jgi:hypothetical protein
MDALEEGISDVVLDSAIERALAVFCSDTMKVFWLKVFWLA